MKQQREQENTQSREAHTNMPIDEAQIAEIIHRHYPTAQAIYLFGSHASGDAWPSSDVDVAVLLPPSAAKRERLLAMSACAGELSVATRAEVDFVNLRNVETLFQKEIIYHGRRLATYDAQAAGLFEMHIVKAYQMLRRERADIIKAGLKSGRFYQL